MSSGLGERKRQAGSRRRRMETHMRKMSSDTVRSGGKNTLQRITPAEG